MTLIAVTAPGAREPLLAPDEPPPFESINAAAKAPFLLVCDHASRTIPRRLGDLGVDAAARRSHIAWDIGAARVTRLLSARLDAPAVLNNYSRLVIDTNRALDDPTSIPVISDGVVIPGNRDLAPEAAAQRAMSLYHPYHGGVAAALARRGEGGRVPALVCVHSFTPVFRGETRPWHVGVLWDRDPRLALPFMEKLGEDGTVHVGDNQPYSGRDLYTYTVDCHAVPAGLPHLAMEIRYDLIEDAPGAARWAARIGDVLAEILADPGLYHAERF